MAGDDDRDRDKQSSAFSRRAVIVGIAQVAGLSVLGGRLYQLQITDGSRYRSLAESNRIAIQLLAPARGRIYDRFGTLLATGEEAFRAIFVPSLSRDPEAVLSMFSRIVPMSAHETRTVIARALRQRPNEPIVLASDLSFEQVARINLLAPHLPGVETEPAAKRRYPQGAVAGHVVGYVGHVEQVALDDDPILRLPWMRAGKTGLELGADKRLRGTSGRVRVEVDAKGHIAGQIDRREADPGGNIVATLDTGLQARVLDRLSGLRRAAVVVMDVHHGEVVVMASVPGYHPGEIVDGLSVATWRKMRAAADDPLINRTISGQYPPGSTFKMVTALAALDAGVVKAGDHVHCQGSFSYADKTFRCWNRGGHGDMNLVDALRESCDVYFYEMARRTGISAIARMAHRLGLGETFPCGLDLQKPGIVPTPDWKIGRLGRRWLGGETILAGIGQGYVLATPLQLAVMTARIATGAAVVPTLIRGQNSSNEPQPLQVAPAALDVVRRGMFACVNAPGGTGTRAQLDDGKWLLAGKTGTSQVSRASSRLPRDRLTWVQRDHALFVAYAPADAPRYAVSVVVEHGGSGGTVAAPIAREIMELVHAYDPLARPAYIGPAHTGNELNQSQTGGLGGAG